MCSSRVTPPPLNANSKSKFVCHCHSLRQPKYIQTLTTSSVDAQVTSQDTIETHTRIEVLQVCPPGNSWDTDQAFPTSHHSSFDNTGSKQNLFRHQEMFVARMET
jgi:hypothetical protein